MEMKLVKANALPEFKGRASEKWRPLIDALTKAEIGDAIRLKRSELDGRSKDNINCGIRVTCGRKGLRVSVVFKDQYVYVKKLEPVD